MEKEKPRSPAALTTPQELKLFIDIAIREERFHDVTSIIENAKIDPIIKDDYEFAYLHGKILALSAPKDNEKELEYSRKVINSAHQRNVEWQLDDGTIWRDLVNASFELVRQRGVNDSLER